jgi:transposase InsO family protein
MPNNIMTDNGTQFTAREFKDFYANSGIKINYALVSYMQSGALQRYDSLGFKAQNFW